jgi:hypothetical protein
MLLGRQLKDFQSVKPNQLPRMSRHRDLASTWQEVAEWREMALAKRSANNQENLSTQVKEHAHLAVGDHVMIQNQAGKKTLRWNKRGLVVEILPHRQYKIRVDGSRQITLRNRKFLRKFTPILEDPTDRLTRSQEAHQQAEQPSSTRTGPTTSLPGTKTHCHMP